MLTSGTDADGQVIKLADFGLAKQLSEGEKLMEGVGSPNYIAPEVLLCLEDAVEEHEDSWEESEGYDFSADLWAAGCVLFILLCGVPPFYADNHDELYDSIIAGQFAFGSEVSLSENAKDLVQKLLVVSPDERLDCEGVLRHPWMTSDLGNLPELSKTSQSMRSFCSKRKWRSSILAVVASNKIATMLDFKKIASSRARTSGRASQLRTAGIRSRNASPTTSPEVSRVSKSETKITTLLNPDTLS